MARIPLARKPLWKKFSPAPCPYCQQPVQRDRLTCPSCGTSVCSFEAGPSSWSEVNGAKKAVKSLTAEE